MCPSRKGGNPLRDTCGEETWRGNSPAAQDKYVQVIHGESCKKKKKVVAGGSTSFHPTEYIFTGKMERRSQLVGLLSFKRQVLAFQLRNCCFL